MLKSLAIVMLGAAVGGALRFLITHYTSEHSHHSGFPIGTLAVNTIGCFLVALILTRETNDAWRLLLATGFCGGFTTFSAFAYETLAYAQAGQLMLMMVNVALNNILGIAASWIAFQINRMP